MGNRYYCKFPCGKGYFLASEVLMFSQNQCFRNFECVFVKSSIYFFMSAATLKSSRNWCVRSISKCTERSLREIQGFLF